MNYLILGHKGQLGAEWCHYLEQAGIPFISADSDTVDITSEKQVRAVMERHHPDIVVNCAAYTDVDGAETETDINDRVNHKGPGILAAACARSGALLVQYSTDYIFSGRLEDKQRYPSGYPEDARPDPVNEYGLAKLRGEEAIRASGADFLIIRVSWLCSSRGKNFLKTMLRLGREKPLLKVVNDQFGAPTFTFDVVDGTQKLIEKAQKGTFHLSSDGIITWYDFASHILKQAGINTKVEPVPSEAFPVKAARPHFSKLGTARFEELTNGQTYSIDDGIARIIAEINRQ